MGGGGGGSTVTAGTTATAATGHYARPRARALGGSLMQGREGRSSRAGSGGAAPQTLTGAAARPRESLTGGHIAHGGCPSAIARYTGWIGQSTGRLSPANA